jgi:hypothetical protein
MIDGGYRSIMIGIPNGLSMLSQGNPLRYLRSRGMVSGRCGTLGQIPLVRLQGVLIFLEGRSILLGNTVVLSYEVLHAHRSRVGGYLSNRVDVGQVS